MLRNRLLTSIVLIPLVVGAVLAGGWWLFVVMGTAIILCGYEYFLMVRAGRHQPQMWLGIALIVALLLDALLRQNLAWFIIIGAVVAPGAAELRRRDHDGFLTNWALTALGVLYIGALGAHLFLLRGLAGGAPLLGIALLATWATDTFAYIAGHAWGRRPFFQEISPKKTWEGAIGGITAALLVFGILASIYGVHPALAFVGGFGLGIAGTVGDLVESLIKRQVGVKDSGSLLAGHGGVLDRLDSMLFAVTFAYYFFVLVHV